MWYFVVFQPSKCKKTHFQPQIWSIWPIIPNDSESLPKVCYIKQKKLEIPSKPRNSESAEGSGSTFPWSNYKYSDLVQVEFISTSAAYHGVTSQLLTSLEEELLKVRRFFPLLFVFGCTSLKGVSQQCDASQRRSLVHGQEKVLHERAHRSATSTFPPQEVPWEVQAPGQEGDLIMRQAELLF